MICIKGAPSYPGRCDANARVPPDPEEFTISASSLIRPVTAGLPVERDDDFFVDAPKEIGGLYSASTTLKTHVEPKSPGYRALLAGDETSGLELVRACRAACGERGLLKVILETGQLDSSARIRRAAEIAVEGGAQFLKTSTGKTQPAATLPAAAVLLEVIAAERDRRRAVGLKPSGGLSRMVDAEAYLDLYEDRFGPGSATPANFRLGASSLIHPVLAALR